VSTRDLQEKIFDPIIKRIERLLHRQISKYNGEGKIDSIILVGGFSQSSYLQQRLRNIFEPAITIDVPPDPANAISQGAVLHARNPQVIRPPVQKYTGRSFALEVQAKFNKQKMDLPENIVINADGIEYAKSSLVYFVKKNALLNIGVVKYEKYVYIEYPNNIAIGKLAANSYLLRRHININYFLY
jgi:molecular chaperone DnaK (HSP70)